MTMERRLGSTGVWVSELCLGTMMFGEWGTKDHDESIRIIHRALDAGITFVDTADVCSGGESEVIVGKTQASLRTASPSTPKETLLRRQLAHLKRQRVATRRRSAGEGAWRGGWLRARGCRAAAG